MGLPTPASVEKPWAMLREWQAVATRYEKTAASSSLLQQTTADYSKA